MMKNICHRLEQTPVCICTVLCLPNARGPGVKELGLVTGGGISTGKIGWWELRESSDPLPTVPKALLEP